MDRLLQADLEAHPAHHETTEQWPIQGALSVRLCLATSLPPPHVSSSILAIVLNADRQVLYLWPSTPTGSIAHLLIGGRPQPGETPEETAIREVGEETGWRIMPHQMIGFRHFFHLEPPSAASDRPYPDFIQPIFAASAVAFDPRLLLTDDRTPAEFMNFSTAEQVTDSAQRVLLYATADALPVCL